MRIPITALCFSLLGLANALNPDIYCVDGIYTALTSVIFNGSSPAAYAQASCQNHLKVGSIYASAIKYCTDHEISAGISWLSNTCLMSGLELLPYTDFQRNLTQDYLDSLRTIGYGETSTETVTTVVIIDKPYYDLGYRTIVCHRPVYSQDSHTERLRLASIFRTGPIIHMGVFYII